MRLTMSSLGLLPFCRYFARDDAERPPASDTTIGAARGHLCHEALAAFGNDPPGTTRPLPEDRAQFEALARRCGVEGEDVDQAWSWVLSWYDHPLSREPWTHEQAVAYDVATGDARLLEVTQRQYVGLAPTEIPGTINRCRTTETEVVVLDNRFGRQLHLVSAEESRALRGYALALCRIFDRPRARLIVAHINDDGTFVTEHVVHARDLAPLAEELRALPAALPTAEPRPGLHCSEGYCPLRATCPSTRAAVVALQPQTPAPMLSLTVDSHEQIAQGLPIIERLEAFVAAWKREARAHVELHGPAPLPNGKLWGRVPVGREEIRTTGPAGAEAIALLLQKGFDPAVKTTTRVVKAELENVLRQQGQAPHAGLRALMKELRRRGMTRAWTEWRLQAFVPKGKA